MFTIEQVRILILFEKYEKAAIWKRKNYNNNNIV